MYNINNNLFPRVPIDSLTDKGIKGSENPLDKKINSIFGNFFSLDIQLLNFSPMSPFLSHQFEEWKSDRDPDLSYKKLKVDLSYLKHFSPMEVKAIKTQCLLDYQKANEAFEQAIGDTALRYVHPNGNLNAKEKGPLLKFANELSQRYLDLYRAYVQYEMREGIPMISNAAGQLKNRGFETEEILKMKEDCQQVIAMLDTFKKHLLDQPELRKNNKELNEYGKHVYNEIKGILFVKENRKQFLEGVSQRTRDPLLRLMVEEVNRYQVNFKTQELLDQAFFMLSKFGKMDFDAIEMQFFEIANLKEYPLAQEDERLLMEIRHRIGGEGLASSQVFPGAVGQNPLAYLNIIKKGEPSNFEGEFREQLYFVYMSNHLVNTFMKNEKLVEFTNLMLQEQNKTWQIDAHFVTAANKQKTDDPPVFRLGSQAALTRYLRAPISTQEKEKYLAKHPNPKLREIMGEKKPAAPLNANFRYELTQRELLNQFGELNIKNLDLEQSVKFCTGASVFHLNEIDELTEKTKNSPNKDDPRIDFAKQYIKMVKKLKIPVISGISGTLDQATTMNGFVGIGVGKNKQRELELIRLAYLAFMVPNSDHSVHEIMQSSKTFGLDYIPGPGFEKQIYPDGGKQFLEYLEEAQLKRGYELPSYYIGNKHVKEVLKNLYPDK